MINIHILITAAAIIPVSILAAYWRIRRVKEASVISRLMFDLIRVTRASNEFKKKAIVAYAAELKKHGIDVDVFMKKELSKYE